MTLNKNICCCLLVAFLLLTACQQKEDTSEVAKVTVLGEGTAFDLATLDFNEDVLRLYTKISEIDSLEALFEVYKRKNPFVIENIKFKAYEIEALGVSIPDFSYGYVFEGKAQDSLARLHGMYFHDMSTLTDMDKKIVAVSASSSHRDKTERDAQLDSLKAIYGSPLLEVAVSSHFDQNSYTWVAKNKIIEVNTSSGVAYEARSSGESKSYRTYQLDLLLIDTKELETLVEAHRNYYDDNYERTFTPKLVKSEFLPELINIRTYFIDDTGQYRIREE